MMEMYLRAIFFFICNDLKVIVIPHTLVGIIQATTGPLLTTNTHPDAWAILYRSYLVLIWNSLNLLTFNLANQRLPQSIAEDSVNKPWRPIPSGLITAAETDWLLVRAVLFTGQISLLWTGAATETLAMVAMTWLYNDLGGGDDSVFLRHGLNGCAFALHTYASTMIAANRDYSILGELLYQNRPEKVYLTTLALQWLAVEGCIVATTIHVMDLPDMDGDRKRGRRTLPLIMGEGMARAILASGMLLWSVVCLCFWNLFERDLVTCVVLLGWSTEVGRRSLLKWDVGASQCTYMMWCVWLVMIYTLPWLAYVRDARG